MNLGYIVNRVKNSKRRPLFALSFLCVLVVGFYVSFALFTTTNEKKGALNITVGNLHSSIKSDSLSKENKIVVAAGVTREFELVLSNTSGMDAKLNLYYFSEADLSNVSVHYKIDKDRAPTEDGIVLSKYEGADFSRTIIITITNNSSSEVAITFGSDAGLFNRELSFPADKHLITKYPSTKISDIIVDEDYVGDGMINRTDAEQTFVTGKNPNNYVWYSGKLWRAVSRDETDRSVKLITQWNMSSISFNGNSDSTYSGSYIEMWLNDTSVDGFLENLREPEKFIKQDSVWNATPTTLTTKPEKTTMVTGSVGMLTIYEYTMSYKGTTSELGYLNNGLHWWTITASAQTSAYRVLMTGLTGGNHVHNLTSVRPVVNLKPSIDIVSGDGSLNNPYRLAGDVDVPSGGELLNTRYSGEYVSFGTGENNLYRIVSKETGGTKLVSDKPLKQSGTYITKKFNTATNQILFDANSPAYELAYFLNNDYLNPANGYVTNSQVAMIQDAIWYRGVTNGSGDSYNKTKCSIAGMNCVKDASPTTAKVGLLRIGEMFATQGDVNTSSIDHWLITPHSATTIWRVNPGSSGISSTTSSAYSFHPVVNLNSNIKIVGGDGTLNSPFIISE